MVRLWQFRGRVHDLGIGLIVAALVQLLVRLVPGDGAAAVGLAGGVLVLFAGASGGDGGTDAAVHPGTMRAA